MRNLFFIILSFFIMSQAVMADDRDAAMQMVKSKMDQALVLVQNKDTSLQEKETRIDQIVSPMFDLSRMAKLSLGKKYWLSLSKEKQGQFTELFIKRIKDSYRSKLALYTDETVVYEEPVQVKKKIHIPTYFVSKDNKIEIRYKIYKSKGILKVYDIEIQGVSLIQTYRSQFREVLQHGTIDDLLLKLEEPFDNISDAEKNNRPK